MREVRTKRVIVCAASTNKAVQNMLEKYVKEVFGKNNWTKRLQPDDTKWREFFYSGVDGDQTHGTTNRGRHPLDHIVLVGVEDKLPDFALTSGSGSAPVSREGAM